ncbi:MAG: hypothetical protein KIS92_09255, partial [Planctomycetota bacterium]|nr:hypothetical protein [Planctomycetota bacterium]
GSWMRATLYLFCLACLWRVFFQVWAHHFGFCLLVAPLATLGVSLHELREAPLFRKVHPKIWAGLTGGLLAGLCVQHALASDAYYRQYGVDLRAPRGHVKLKEGGGLGEVEAGLVRFLERLPPGTRVLPFPQGVGAVFFSGQENSNRALLFYPVNFLDDADEDAMLRDLEARPPDVILWGMGADFVDYRRGIFGKDYARRVCAWIEARYEPWLMVGEGDVVRVMRPRRSPAAP